MSDTVVGEVVVEVNGVEYDAVSFSAEGMTGNKPVPTMNSKGRVNKKTKGAASTTLSFSVVVDPDNDIDWLAQDDMTVTAYSIDGSYRTTYRGVEVETVSDAAKAGGEFTRDIKCFALQEPIREDA